MISYSPAHVSDKKIARFQSESENSRHTPLPPDYDPTEVFGEHKGLAKLTLEQYQSQFIRKMGRSKSKGKSAAERKTKAGSAKKPTPTKRVHYNDDEEWDDQSDEELSYDDTIDGAASQVSSPSSSTMPNNVHLGTLPVQQGCLVEGIRVNYAVQLSTSSPVYAPFAHATSSVIHQGELSADGMHRMDTLVVLVNKTDAYGWGKPFGKGYRPRLSKQGHGVFIKMAVSPEALVHLTNTSITVLDKAHGESEQRTDGLTATKIALMEKGTQEFLFFFQFPPHPNTNVQMLCHNEELQDMGPYPIGNGDDGTVAMLPTKTTTKVSQKKTDKVKMGTYSTTHVGYIIYLPVEVGAKKVLIRAEAEDDEELDMGDMMGALDEVDKSSIWYGEESSGDDDAMSTNDENDEESDEEGKIKLLLYGTIHIS